MTLIIMTKATGSRMRSCAQVSPLLCPCLLTYPTELRGGNLYVHKLTTQTQTPRYIWGQWLETGIVWGWILHLFHYFTSFYVFLWVNYAFLKRCVSQVWG